jgi:hypothetical protein
MYLTLTMGAVFSPEMLTYTTKLHGVTTYQAVILTALLLQQGTELENTSQAISMTSVQIKFCLATP